MDWLNYHHLHYFWLVAREGGVGRAAQRLRLSHPTVSAQVKALEDMLGERLFEKRGRGLVLTEMGRVVYDYADEIFTIGRELVDTVRGRPTGRPVRLVVGIVDVLPKLIARRLIEPASALPERIQLVCREASAERLLAELALHTVDVVLTDAPLPAGSGIKAFNHELGESGVGFYAGRALAERLRPGFPESLTGAPMYLPTSTSTLRRALDQYFETRGLRPEIVAEFDDSALMKVFGESGRAVFPAPTIIEQDVCRTFGVVPVGPVEGLRERYYALSAERRLRNPAVIAMTQAARALGATGA
ncbi:MAG: transcriptional activator NhaR [Bradymonadia bacterium]|jgi:LysR family transcriptional activator of nhaA